MGDWVHSTTGYGIRLPSGEEDEYTPSEWAKQFYTDDIENPDWYELGEALEKKFPGTHYEQQYVSDYSEGSVLFIGQKSTNYRGISELEIDNYTSGHYETLREVSQLLDIQFEPGWWTVVSYG